MKSHRIVLAALLLMTGLSCAGAADDLAPLSLSVFGFYGTPIQPLSLAQSNTDGSGFDFLAEYQPSHYAAFGIDYETAAFYGSQSLNAGSLNLEGRLFPFAGMKQPYSPYILGEAGLNLYPGSPSQWGGVYTLKTGLGTKVNFVGPLSLDFAVESHWMGDSPNFFQYMDARIGIDYAISFQAPPAPTATPAPTAVSPAPTPTPVPQAASPSPTPTVLIPEYTPVPPVLEKEPAHSLMKKYYLMGTKALKARKYVTALKDMKKAVSYKEKVAYYYYAEAYATMGVIYQFHSKVRHHLNLALANYQKAWKIDPNTVAVKKYYKKLKAQLAKPVHAVKHAKGGVAAATPGMNGAVSNSSPAAQPAAPAAPSTASNPPPAAAPAATPNNGTIPIDMGNGK